MLEKRLSEDGRASTRLVVKGEGLTVVGSSGGFGEFRKRSRVPVLVHNAAVVTTEY